MRHKHKCDACGTVWEHDPDEPGFNRVTAHFCPTCGVEELYHYDGPKPPDFVDGKRILEPDATRV